MSVIATPTPTTSDLPPIQLDSATWNSLMSAAGWHRTPDGGWTKPLQLGPVDLTPVVSSGVYPEFELHGCPAIRTTPSKHLMANAHVAGPGKFVIPRGRRRPVFRLALPPSTAEFVVDPDRELDDAAQYLAWVTDMTALVSPSPSPSHESSELDFEACTAQLKSNGWNAESGPDRTMVHVQRRGLYSQIVLAPHPRGGCRIGADLIDLSDVAQVSRRAAARIASIANRRLPMTRFTAEGAGDAIRLRCEVHLGHGPISNDWLLASTEAVEAGIVLTVRELQAAVRDTQLANLVVAAPAA